MATNNLSADDVCSICLCPLQNQVARLEISQTPCQHIFHHTCLTDWITNGNPGGCCPLCKKEMRACDAIPVRIENVALPAPNMNNNRDIDNGEAVVIPLRRSQRLRGRQMSSNISDRNETPTTANNGMLQGDQQVISQDQHFLTDNIFVNLQQELQRASHQLREQLQEGLQRIFQPLQRDFEELHRHFQNPQ